MLAAWLQEASHGLAQRLRREESVSESLLDDLLVDMGGDCAGEQGAARAPERRAPGAPGGIGLLSPREVERRPLADLGEESDRSPTGVLVEVASAAMANQAAAGLSHGSRKVKGPERFYYDTSTYTGAHRFPGPSVDGKENFGNSRQRRDSGALTVTSHTQRANHMITHTPCRRLLQTFRLLKTPHLFFLQKGFGGIQF